MSAATPPLPGRADGAREAHPGELRPLAPRIEDAARDLLAGGEAEVERLVASESAGAAAARHRAKVIDGLLQTLYAAAEAATGPMGPYALCAVGGYGRGLLAPRSDIDLLFLADSPDSPRLLALVEAVLYPLWDLKLHVGHAVRTVDSSVALACEDLKTATTLLDVRRVAGDGALVERLLEEGHKAVFSRDLGAFVAALRADARARQDRFGGTLYLLEPDVKLGLGGLRDFDVGLWAAKAATRIREPEQLPTSGLLSTREWDEVRRAREFQWLVRHYLHTRAAARTDRLSFEDQEEIAVKLGYRDGVSLGVEQFMQVYYQHARTIASTMERLLDRSTPPPQRRPEPEKDLGEGLGLFDGKVTLRDPALAGEPQIALRLFRVASEQGAAVHPHALDRISRGLEETDLAVRLRDCPAAARELLWLLARPAAAPARWPRDSYLGALHGAGLLTAMLPEFVPITGRVQHDVYHVFTVDVHSIAAVDRLRALGRGELGAELPLPTRAMGEIESTTALYLGVLLHDVGKSEGKDHARTGARMAADVARRLGLGADEVAEVEFLVREHLQLYHYAMRRDVGDPGLVDEFARLCGSLDRLRKLYVLTIVDLGTTGPTVLTAWKAAMLGELYVRAAEVLGGRQDDRAERVRSEVLDQARGNPAARDYVESLPDRYFRLHNATEIAWHIEGSVDRPAGVPRVRARARPEERCTELLVVADDRPGLLARIAAALTANRLDILWAHIHSRRVAGGTAEAIDLIGVRRGARDELDPQTLAHFEKDLGRLLCDQTTPKALLAERGVASQRGGARGNVRRGPPVVTDVEVDNRISPTHTVVDVFTRDRPGVLWGIASALEEMGLSIAVARVGTEGDRVVDAFYVADLDGAKIVEPAAIEALKAAIRRRLDTGAPGAPGV